MDTVSLELWSGEAGHHENVLRAILEDVRKLSEDLRQAVAIPQGCVTIHRRANDEVTFGVLGGLEDDL